MSVVKSRPALRWLVPGVAAVVVIGGGAAIGTLSATAEPSLPPRSAAQLLVDLQTARLEGLSGTVVQKAELGLPSVAELAGKVGSGLTSLVAGTHTLRVWYAGPDQARVALMDTRGETDVIRNGKDLWIWSSQSKQAAHHTLTGATERAKSLAGALPTTPQEAADQALAAIGPSTEVTVGRSAKIAGRDAYELVLAPRDKNSLVGQARIAIDATEHVPLRFEVYPKGSDDTAFEVAFTQVDFGRPEAEQFRFNPPPGTKVTEGSGVPGLLPEMAHEKAAGKATARSSRERDAVAEPTTVGEGWTTVVVARLGGAPGESDAQAQGVLSVLPRVSGAWGGGRLLSSRLFSVLVTDDGRVLGGAVSPERLYEVAATAK
ncbi:Outer membrane lipoprotein-sorting protein [Micromonospora pattaloongensis]|uniref:Outer membrane lipoprotein-sorting protein n=1 Tax=Micromonospora pattaloongensis TaxID=405436 RepID=A0A1H3JFT3_9ACTN|nr:hypothetical protein [Micromonospora pattaloongensis]SDY38890.1 Outer membrane lipoprotein-sorting protein [Micromonospora pattaloongensis]